MKIFAGMPGGGESGGGGFAAVRGPLTVHYGSDDTGRASLIRIIAVSGGHTSADIQLTLSDVATNTTLDPRTFT